MAIRDYMAKKQEGKEKISGRGASIRDQGPKADKGGAGVLTHW